MLCCYDSNNDANCLATMCGSFSYGHVKCQLKPIPVTAVVMMSYHCHGVGNIFVIVSDCFPHYSLGNNQLTDTGAIVLATALQHNKSLAELK